MAESERLVRRHMPVASLERLRELGLDPDRYGSCAARDPQNHVRGCPYWDSCRFDRPDWGGFKGTRPHNIGYFLRTHEGRKKADFIACYGFVAALQARMIEGMSAELKGEKHEFIRIIGQEGAEIPVKLMHEAPLQPGQPWNSPREIVAEYKKVPVPPYPDPQERDESLEYENELSKLMVAMPEMQAQMTGVDMGQAVAAPAMVEQMLEEKPKRGRAS